MWCVAPTWEPHALHIAVEFVHPVIVGKRALPAVALTGPDLVATGAGVAVRPGDILVAVAGCGDADVRRPDAPRSGLGRRPRSGSGRDRGPRPEPADHVLWLDDPDPTWCPATGGFVLFYHLLWELTHVCFEHPGLLKPEPAEVCVTCCDEGDGWQAGRGVLADAAWSSHSPTRCRRRTALLGRPASPSAPGGRSPTCGSPRP